MLFYKFLLHLVVDKAIRAGIRLRLLGPSVKWAAADIPVSWCSHGSCKYFPSESHILQSSSFADHKGIAVMG